MIPSQRKAIELNNRAAYLIELGQFEEASEKLTNSLNIAHKALNDENDQSSRQPIHTSIDEWMATNTYDNEVSYEVSDEEQQHGYIYRTPIFIACNLKGVDEIGVLTSIAGIFNLALAHHLPGLSMDGEAKKLQLNKSKRLYELAFNLQLQTSDRFNMIFTMAVINNLGAIYKELKDNETAGKCFERVLSTLMYAVDCGDQTVTEICDGFIRNTTHLYSIQCTAAAA